MPSVNVTNREGETRKVEVSAGLSLMENIRLSGFGDIFALCGGSCSCATCHVYIDAPSRADLSPMSADENELLDSSSHRTAQSRLSCQIVVTDAIDGLTVTVAPEE
jgi:2Fe-2S ferredoxin